jgi:hypothetical protein
MVCVDVDECKEDKGVCSHKCENEEGGFRCLCPPGYRLTADLATCKLVSKEARTSATAEQSCRSTRKPQFGHYRCNQKKRSGLYPTGTRQVQIDTTGT